jgi:hypothetical protein
MQQEKTPFTSKLRPEFKKEGSDVPRLEQHSVVLKIAHIEN